MSIPSNEKLPCPKCKHEQMFTIWNSINVTLDPKLKEQLISGELNRFACESCGQTTWLNYAMIYHDMRQQVMMMLCFKEVPTDTSIDPVALSMTKAMAMAHYRCRLVHSRNELLEKILIFDAGLDDRVVEVYKIVLEAQVLREGRKADQILFDGIGEGDGERSLRFAVFSGGIQSRAAMRFPAADKMPTDNPLGLPDPKTEAGKWLRVDAEYARRLMETT